MGNDASLTPSSHSPPPLDRVAGFPGWPHLGDIEELQTTTVATEDRARVRHGCSTAS